jgi:hypothetical protein
MKVGFGFSNAKDPEEAVQEAYRKSLQRLKSTKADFCFVVYSYDYNLDTTTLGALLKRILKYVPHLGCSAQSAWGNAERFDAERGLLVMSLKDLPFEMKLYSVNSLREKEDLWATELARHIGDSSVEKKQDPDSLMIFADSLSFKPGNGFDFLDKHFNALQVTGLGTSFSIPQCSVINNGESYMNALVAALFYGAKPWVGLIQNIRPELEPISVNRMSENLVIEIDEKPAFYRLCEHLMAVDDLPMMSQDEFRKHMGNLYIVEKAKDVVLKPRVVGDAYRAIPLLGSEMTTGMVAVGDALDFNKLHYLGQKKSSYAEEGAQRVVNELKENVPDPGMIWMFQATSRKADTERQKSDYEIISEAFPKTPVLGILSNGEYLGGVNQHATVVVAFPS